MNAVMLTTIDNPFDPFKEWDQWRRFDEDRQYYTCNYLARIALTSDELSDEDNQLAIENAINEIVELNITGLYRKVYEQ